MMPVKIAEGKVLGAEYGIFSRTGIVAQSDIRSETEVSGQIVDDVKSKT